MNKDKNTAQDAVIWGRDPETKKLVRIKLTRKEFNVIQAAARSLRMPVEALALAAR